MWTTMKTYSMHDEEDIDEILLNIKNEFNNVFEFNRKSIQNSNTRTITGMDLILLKANLTPLQIQKTNSSKSLLRKNSKKYFVSCINIKNNKGEYFSSLVNNLCENDRIVLINGVVLKQFTICNSNKLTVLVRPQDHSSVILFKYKHLLEKSNSILEKNLSLLTGSGVYSIFGNIKKIVRFNDDDEVLSLTLLSCDKSKLKTLKYSHFGSGYKNINKETASGVKYDFCSNRVDILVKTPSNDFNSLSLNQRISLNDVKVENINDSDIFLLHMNGYSHNIKADPIETGIVNSLRPPTRHFSIPSELKHATKLKLKKMSNDVKLVLTDNIQELNTNISPLETERLNVQQCEHNNIQFVNLSDDDDDDDDDDDIVNLSPCQDFLTSTQIKKKDNYVHSSAGSLGKKKVDIIDDNSLPIKHLRSDNEVQKCNENSLLTSSNKDTFLQRNTSPSSSTDGSCSPSFFNSQPETSTLNRETQSNNFKLNNVNEPTQCIGPCRLIHTVPNIFDNNEIVSGYCTKCNAFIQKCYLKSITQSSKVEYKCPTCFSIVHLTFFFMMNFLYGKNDSQAIEVCCYDKNAERIIGKILKIKMMNIEEYLSNQNNRQLVINSMKSLINNRTKVNIIVCLSPDDNKNILLGLDTKYVVTTPTQ
ncbi:uncharacterized protein LOC111040291 isoform X2 [Myzus persicae]|nr:uncharacterized protein LOC111040291 isoform X2 [Myzus persicae]XP_022179838.1 uncharacterized protein LOC111040291 isoform X2 [Myzus persicae]XP_022179839.1 uncharacterized protein LOC111040291 isoform X2 [Myzus persicae]XP_022179840.1 uncharacterized protein LOC111040291 isoform X2 [Myzus persicae]XP_022179841.1 uncharacterized protein LOC111040291 isoform X2 [Myzus persicae]XP_022179842.1 uncharacterized protein LOC111040291 isoform X2 [Myzus persicae]